MPDKRKRQRDPSKGFEGLLRFLRAKLTPENYESLTQGAFDDAPLMGRVSDVDLQTARDLQAASRACLDRLLTGQELQLSLESMLLVRLCRFAENMLMPITWKARISDSTLMIEGAVDRPVMPYRACLYRMPGCLLYYSRLASRPKLHCGNPSCRTQYDKKKRKPRAKRPPSGHPLR